MQKHGGKREGAGRPSLGITKKVSITLPEEAWKRIEDSDKPYSKFFRDVTLKELKK
ncbi:CopG family transcriptional regulator [Bacillus pseudomycoides]|uniref:CopG family transcriptional regulator n=1 Tax=Bacillus pseudomycoides TaxID=64104 RepID=UPI000BFAA576|nr:CopG family transcriptional regulator [Bacillus pseudomycoides]PFZ05227.1 CopG family transcriptional regulator [Bacillus pseudomycoides]